MYVKGKTIGNTAKPKLAINILVSQATDGRWKVTMTINGQHVLVEQPYHDSRQQAETYAAGLVVRDRGF